LIKLYSNGSYTLSYTANQYTVDILPRAVGDESYQRHYSRQKEAMEEAKSLEDMINNHGIRGAIL